LRWLPRILMIALLADIGLLLVGIQQVPQFAAWLGSDEPAALFRATVLIALPIAPVVIAIRLWLAQETRRLVRLPADADAIRRGAPRSAVPSRALPRWVSPAMLIFSFAFGFLVIRLIDAGVLPRWSFSVFIVAFVGAAMTIVPALLRRRSGAQ
jgi:hypothetical protein